MREFETGATRDTDNGKFDYEGFLSPQVIEAFAAYMHKNRRQADGSLRASDNWQKGMGKDVYMKSAFRHFMDLWMIHRGLIYERPENGEIVTFEDAIGGLMFNIQGYWHETLQEDLNPRAGWAETFQTDYKGDRL